MNVRKRSSFYFCQAKEESVMRITFEQMTPANTDKVTKISKTAVPQTKGAQNGISLDISAKVTDNEAYGIHGRNAEEVMQSAASEDITQYRNYMAVMSNSMSEEDFAELVKEGYNPNDTEIDTAVTIVDTIKAELLKAGVSVAGYTDNLNMEELTEITGSMTFAEELVASFAKEDIPLTKKNVQSAMDAFRRGKEIESLTEGTIQYIVQNEITPDIDQLYLAGHSGARDTTVSSQGYFQDELPGYYGQKASTNDNQVLIEQIDKFLGKNGFEVSDENRKDALWLVNSGILLTSDNFTHLKEVSSLSLPADDKELFSAIAASLSMGRTAGEAKLTNPKSIYVRAAECKESYDQKYEVAMTLPETKENIKSRRQLEEVRLHMTVEANVKLLKSGFSIDTAPIEETINALKELEAKEEQSIATASDSTALLKETVRKTEVIPYLPSSALGELLVKGTELTVNSVYETGVSQRQEYEKAGNAYETMMTSPRADLGDNIKTAFRNVDALLENMGQELTDENRKAVRSLAYNNMDLTEENLLAIKGAEKTVTRVVEKMTPSNVLNMIRDGINPLTTPLEEINEYLEQQSSYTEESTKYSRFLYNLEQNHEITAEEKESFIGAYRLLRQVEKSDGAAIGKLVDTGAQINFENLLSAVRTGKIKGIDVSIDNQVSTEKEIIGKGIAIDTQIESAYEKQRLAEIREVNQVSDAAITVLETLEEPVTVDNLLAVDAIRQNGSKPFRKLVQVANEEYHKLLENTGELDYTNREEFTSDYQELMKSSEELAESSTFQVNTSVDIRELQMTCKQLHLGLQMAVKNEEYDLPEIMNGEITMVHLKLVHNSDRKGQIKISMDTEQYGELTGEFFMEDNTLSGLFAGNSEEAVNCLKEVVTKLQNTTTDENIHCENMQVVIGKLNREAGNADKQSNEKEVETKSLYKTAGIIIRAVKATIQQEELHEN